MKIVRITCGILLMIPIVLIVNYILNPFGYWPGNSSASEMLLLILGLPIILLNILVWTEPRIAEEIFLSKWEINFGAIAFIGVISVCSFGLVISMFRKPPAERQPIVIPTRSREQKMQQTVTPEALSTDLSILITPTTISSSTSTALPHAASPFVIYYNGGLDEGFGMGVDTSGNQTNWVTPSQDGGQCMAYPAGQSWGAVFITVGDPGSGIHPKQDFSSYGSLSVELKGGNGDETVQVGLKTDTDPDDGSETKYSVSGLTTEWKTFVIPLDEFNPIDLSSLYVVTEFVFGTTPETVCFRNIQFQP